MTRFVVDCGVILRLASDGIEVHAEHELRAPTLLRSQRIFAAAGFTEVSRPTLRRVVMRIDFQLSLGRRGQP